MSQEKATFGAGCFWGVEAALAAIPGVTATAVGYEGGSLERPSYKDVCTDQTGHAEVVEVDFDPVLVSFEQLLDAFFTLHDPTTLNRQGPDWGTQYRSAVFYHSPEQKAAAEAKIAELNASGRFNPKRVDQSGTGPDLLARRGVPPAVSGKARAGKLPHLERVERKWTRSGIGPEGFFLRKNPVGPLFSLGMANLDSLSIGRLPAPIYIGQ